MLFNSPVFIFCFLPIVLILFRLTAFIGPKTTIGGLVVASLFFYGWWNPSFVPLLIGSTLFNYAIGRALATLDDQRLRRWLFGFGVAVDLGILAIFKYLGFFIATIDTAAGAAWAPPTWFCRSASPSTALPRSLSSRTPTGARSARRAC